MIADDHEGDRRAIGDSDLSRAGAPTLPIGQRLHRRLGVTCVLQLIGSAHHQWKSDTSRHRKPSFVRELRNY